MYEKREPLVCFQLFDFCAEYHHGVRAAFFHVKLLSLCVTWKTKGFDNHLSQCNKALCNDKNTTEIAFTFEHQRERHCFVSFVSCQK